MKLAILSRGARLYSTRRLKEAAQERDHSVKVLDTLRFSIEMARHRPTLHYKNKQVKGGDYDAIIPRIGSSITHFGTAVVRQFEQMGVYTLSTSQAITMSRDKLRASQVLSRHDIGQPETAFVRDKGDVLPAIARVGGAPVIIKLLEGTQGIGVILAETEQVASAIIETLQSAKQNVLIQKFVAESKGKDIRAFVVGDRVVAAMRRRAAQGEFRSNTHRGGKPEVVALDEEYTQAAIHAARILGLEVAGVDMLEGAEGPQIMEVNSSPGLEGIEASTGIDVAGAIIEYVETHFQFPDVDIQHKLRFKTGNVVADIPVHPKSELAKQTLAELDLRSKDILIMSVTRGSMTTPNPDGAFQLLPGDQLLCYGNRLELQGLMPPPKKRRRKSKSKK